MKNKKYIERAKSPDFIDNEERKPAQEEASRYNTAWLDRTVEVWQPLTARKLTREDALEITINTAGFFRILLEWEAAEKQRAKREDKS